MQIRVISARPWDIETDVLAIPVAESEPTDGLVIELDRRLGGALSAYRRLGELTGKAWQSALSSANGGDGYRTGGDQGTGGDDDRTGGDQGTGGDGDRTAGAGRRICARWLLGIGVGKRDEFDRVAAFRLGSALERRLAGRSVGRLAVYLPNELTSERIDQARLVELVVRGVVEGMADPMTLYRENGEAEFPPQLSELTVIVADGDVGSLERAAGRGAVIGEGGVLARRLSQRSSNDVSPEVLADEAAEIASRHGLALTVIGPDEAARLGMGMFLAVGRGSDNPPRFIALRSGSDGQTDRRGRLLAMVGKGVTFDSGGISIKPADRMEEMKMDKTGACTVLAAIDTVSRLAPGLPLLAVAPAVENMPGPHSTRPGDVVRALNGKVVEINNTDAEGRLILGDALTWAERQGATHLVDVATLTAAVERALGKLVTGGFGSPQAWWDEVADAGARQGERYWQIPLVDEYRADMESWYADFQNSSSPEGSLVKSGLFLREFVTRPWAHLDIAGTAWLRKATPWAPRGATGVSHATLVELALAGA